MKPPNDNDKHADVFRELAASGLVCSECGGIHCHNIDTGILLTSVNRHGIGMPACECCVDCKNFQLSIEQLIKQRNP